MSQINKRIYCTYILYSVQYTVHCILYTVYCIPYTAVYKNVYGIILRDLYVILLYVYTTWQFAGLWPAIMDKISGHTLSEKINLLSNLARENYSLPEAQTRNSVIHKQKVLKIKYIFFYKWNKNNFW